ncbi:MAG: hypothetical protein KAR33_04955 [Candidatus Thorarchaeota archaeon]|nr:hypothetical protein [Candidatus Thorarchaeota archaeon]
MDREKLGVIKDILIIIALIWVIIFFFFLFLDGFKIIDFIPGKGSDTGEAFFLDFFRSR